MRTRTRGINDSKSRLTVEELQLFANQLDTLPAKGIWTNIQKCSCNWFMYLISPSGLKKNSWKLFAICKFRQACRPIYFGKNNLCNYLFNFCRNRSKKNAMIYSTKFHSIASFDTSDSIRVSNNPGICTSLISYPVLLYCSVLVKTFPSNEIIPIPK